LLGAQRATCHQHPGPPGEAVSVHPGRATHGTESTDGHRTVIALVSATLISFTGLALRAIFDVE
jgi:hypothetical protein